MQSIEFDNPTPKAHHQSPMVNGLDLLTGDYGNTLSVTEMMLAQAQKEKVLQILDQQSIQSETQRRSYATMNRLVQTYFSPKTRSNTGPPTRKGHKKTKKKIVTRRRKGSSK